MRSTEPAFAAIAAIISSVMTACGITASRWETGSRSDTDIVPAYQMLD